VSQRSARSDCHALRAGLDGVEDDPVREAALRAG
jgi:hypothetical protein